MFIRFMITNHLTSFFQKNESQANQNCYAKQATFNVAKILSQYCTLFYYYNASNVNCKINKICLIKRKSVLADRCIRSIACLCDRFKFFLKQIFSRFLARTKKNGLSTADLSIDIFKSDDTIADGN